MYKFQKLREPQAELKQRKVHIGLVFRLLKTNDKCFEVAILSGSSGTHLYGEQGYKSRLTCHQKRRSEVRE